MAQPVLNPIFDLARQGQRRQRAAQWPEAVDAYQKALSCLPNIFGRQSRLKHELTSHPSSDVFTPSHAARIYDALSGCLSRLGRQQDGRLAAIASQRLLEDHANPMHRRPAGEGAWSSPSPSSRQAIEGPVQDVSALADWVTLIMVTHCADGLVRFKSLAPPSTRLLTATYGSLVQMFGPQIGTCPQWLCYDRPATASALENDYRQGLRRFSRQHGFELQCFDHIGLFAILEQVVPRVRTPYVLFVEHDWMFRGPAVPLEGVVADMNRNRRINCVRFNKRENQIDGMDYILTADGRQGNCPLLRTASHSNNPSLLRTGKLRDAWLPLCRDALRRVAGHLGGSAFGVEEVLFRRHAEDIRRMGFDAAHESWGTYVYGRPGDPARVVHLGE